jgi:hypothetical protein
MNYAADDPETLETNFSELVEMIELANVDITEWIDYPPKDSKEGTNERGIQGWAAMNQIRAIGEMTLNQLND